MKAFLSITLCSICLVSTFGQTNYVSNSGFENGGTPQCQTACTAAFDGVISSWYNAVRHPAGCQNCSYDASTNNCNCSWGPKCTTSDWYDHTTCLYTTPVPYISNAFVHCLSKTKYGEGIRESLTQTLNAGGKYTLRFRYAAGNPNCGFETYLTKFSSHWNKKPHSNGNEKFKIGTFGGQWLFPNNTFASDTWTSTSISFTIPSNLNALSNLVLVLKEGPDGAAYLDDVELYDGDCFSGDLHHSNKTFIAYEAPYEFQNIFSGPSVKVDPTANVTYKATTEITLSDGFEATDGTEFHAYIAPCGSACPAPTMPTTNYTICDGLPITIGSSAQPNLSYTWTGFSPVEEAFLSATNISDPTFTPPSGVGTLSYTVTVSNNCGGSSSLPVIIHYSDISDPNPSVTISNTDMSGDYISFDLSYNPNTEFIYIQVFDGGGNLVMDDELEQGVDFWTSPFHWQIDENFKNCDNYTINVTSSNFCNTNISPVASISWSKSVPITVTPPNIFTPNYNGTNDQFCLLNVTGANNYVLNVYSNSGALLHTSSGPIVPPPTPTSPQVCLWDGTCTNSACTNQGGVLPDATYFYILDLFNSDCDTKLSTPGYVQVFSASPNKMSMNTNSQSFQIKLIPNPNNGHFQILNTTKNVSNFEIYDLSGKKLMCAENFQNNQEINLTAVEDGLYFIKFFSQEGALIETQKIVKVK